ncbi:hydrogenase maturation nickel metallochaperone HypA [Thermodesulfovibrio thiophilus]|uniref:hydrogenase maturation nickel metallochaperone HypA n=1 Tax=Thermodesulfovibrio thiophilus TaxID=340095 RepID=UPI0004248930|nr:hydrogenase maturation nickel metallochaperone HypA [Thermodesulfovibrio thiophilus]HHW19996.1 hydrogenase maturation nickel metallochaperone HypA [Thermodesulfovibrio thiophilus]
MHEASIAYELLNIATRECGRNGYSKIQSIKVIVGRASGVMTDALLFAFNVLKEGTPAQDAELIVEEIPVKGLCKECGHEFTSNESYLVVECPFCGSFSLEIVSGRELNITEMEVNDEN